MNTDDGIIIFFLTFIIVFFSCLAVLVISETIFIVLKMFGVF